MSRFDRYVLSQLLVLFGFFSLILVAVYWVNSAVELMDLLIANGQSTSVFLEFTVLSLPGIIRHVIPFSTFAATVYVINRLSSESELTVMQATGFSPWRLARPVMLFGVIIFVMMSTLTHYLVPSSLYQFNLRQAEVSQNLTARLLTEGEFLHPTDGVTFYIRDITPEGVLKDVYLSDRRDDEQISTYTAAEAYLVNDASGAKLVMVDGLSQILVQPGGRLFTTNFSDFTYDISSLIRKPAIVRQSIRYMPTGQLLTRSYEIADELNTNRGDILEEAHSRFGQPLTSALAALVAFGTLLLGGYSRFGVWKQIVLSFVMLISLEIVRSAVLDPVRANGDLWPLIYLPAALGLCLALVLLSLSAYPPSMFKRRGAA
ncbi:LPS export ABC transporter permease LptF [Shimia sp. SDUM112013]|uniref:LPS export ABC transporter permease LptF n=1 Tax=Shimia sp. SDUM112013 TaxID=3136160 RepID=UPI0032EC1338